MKYPYRLILISNGKEIDAMGAYHTEKQGLKALNDLSKQQLKNVLFPTRYINTTKIEEAKYELVLIKKRTDDDPKSARLRNEYGEFVEHTASKDMWLIIDKAPYVIEEKFWVYGYHPISDRKDYNFVFDELVKPKATHKNEFLNLQLFKNKILLESNKQTDLVLCKNHSDAIRLYNTIKENCIKNKYKYVIYSGDCGTTHYSRNDIIEKIMKLTNWNKQKVIRQSTKTQTGKGRHKKEKIN